MEWFIAILLWLGAIQTGVSYTQQEFDDIVAVNQPVINAVMADPLQQEVVWASTGTHVPDVIVGEGE